MFGLDFGISTLATRLKQDAFRPTSIAGLLAWYDPTDAATLFQDAAMTTPVTADGDPVGAVMDKSGNDYHLTQSSVSQRPTYRTSDGVSWIESDGADDIMSGALTNLGADPDVYLTAGLRILSQSQADHRVFELGSGSGALSGAYGSAGWSWRYNNGNSAFSSSAVGDDLVVRWQRNAGNVYAESQIYVDGSQLPQLSATSSTLIPSLSTTELDVFDSNSGGSPGQIRLYGLVVCTTLSSSDAATLDTYLESVLA